MKLEYWCFEDSDFFWLVEKKIRKFKSKIFFEKYLIGQLNLFARTNSRTNFEQATIEQHLGPGVGNLRPDPARQAFPQWGEQVLRST